MVKLKLSGDGEYFQLAEILGGLNLNQKQFRQMCIAAGCDYLTNVKGVGIHTAFRFVKHSTEDLLELLIKEEQRTTKIVSARLRQFSNTKQYLTEYQLNCSPEEM
jgi:5'-3' exonuclease